MQKTKIYLSQLKRIDNARRSTISPKEQYIEQELSYYDDGSYFHVYECPCGKGHVIDDKDATPGFRSHDIFIQCRDCNELYEIG